ncbi:DUF3748 domain-containing protein [Budviciaceae bacterium BWR-B9]|uniref:DUF3748 domain-containing protein n=1 Tax=Limnobaculum allomyrinae TaxID=2791986 RepID=A0ABS1IPI7_9GAMM|nr:MULTISPECIES: DUF3748 domain-containing protein [Limnobaculum]MBK5143675.1 DUF3748 domain-containing protein [Limnobaculum allomyrinae]MBV7692691.1 DUF3748 domain-containing protein [Limnobaculum sp. M2-1]
MRETEKQITYTPCNHQLTNVNVWTPDSQWLIYDVRPDGSSFTGETIERVNINSCEVEIVYQAEPQSYVGVVTASPVEPVRYAFIHSPEQPDEQWHYDFHHRRGVIVTEPDRKHAVTLDALDITPPFTSGALRGGSHVHVFSPDGSRLSFTYNDHVMHEKGSQFDQRNIGVAVPLHSVHVEKQHVREYDGSHFCVLVSSTVLVPEAGSDEISRAYEEGWVGNEGYITPQGTIQRWALAFIGDTRAEDGSKLSEVFIVDLPEHLEDYAKPGEYPLTGTMTLMPAPPASVSQRRLTYTGDRRFPGVVSSPRHWIRSSPDGSKIAFLMKDDFDVVQVWLVSPQGGELKQVTDGGYGVDSAFSWSPDGRSLAFVMDGSIVLCDVNSGVVKRLTEKNANHLCADAVVFSPNGEYIAYMRKVDGFSQLFITGTEPD